MDQLPAFLRRGNRSTGQGPGPDGAHPQELYDIDSDLPEFHDVHKQTRRPSVVLRRIDELRMVTVMTRTTNLDVDGVAHPRTPELGLDKDGKFDPKWVQTVGLVYFVYPLVELLGVLDDDTWAKVVEAWESS